jgi:UTP-glucose-1-phosphate uridylyltransferase
MIICTSLYRQFVNRHPITVELTDSLSDYLDECCLELDYICAQTTIDVIGIRRVNDANRPIRKLYAL